MAQQNTDIEKVKKFVQEMQGGWYPLRYISGISHCLFDINAQDENGNTFWHYNFEVCPDRVYNQGLLKDFCRATDQKIDLSKKNKQGISVLGSLIGNKNNPFVFEDILRYPEFYKSIDYTAQNENGTSMLMYLVQAGFLTSEIYMNYIKELCEHSEILNLQDKSGNTALHYACQLGTSIQGVQMLIESGADIRIKNNNGLQPIDMIQENRELSNLLSAYMTKETPELNKQSSIVMKHSIPNKMISYSNGRAE